MHHPMAKFLNFIFLLEAPLIEEIVNVSICLFGYFELKMFFMHFSGADYIAKFQFTFKHSMAPEHFTQYNHRYI